MFGGCDQGTSRHQVAWESDDAFLAAGRIDDVGQQDRYGKADACSICQLWVIHSMRVSHVICSSAFPDLPLKVNKILDEYFSVKVD